MAVDTSRTMKVPLAPHEHDCAAVAGTGPHKKFSFLRPYGAGWNERIVAVGRRVRMSRIYAKEGKLNATVTGASRVALDTLSTMDQEEMRERYGADVREVLLVTVEVER